MSKLIPIQYHGKKYPNDIDCNIIEVAGNFDKVNLEVDKAYSLHTEYSYMKRKLDTELLEGLDEIKKSHKQFVPQLWKNEKWAIEFAEFIIRLIGDNPDPEIIEIHPPFNDYCKNFDTFINCYVPFYEIIKNRYKETKIFLENRCGTYYTGGKFLLSTCDEVIELCKVIKRNNIDLNIVLDYPQIFSAEKIKLDNIQLEKIINFNNKLKDHTSVIGGFHMWGKRKSVKGNRWTSHIGNFDTLFSFNIDKKKQFLKSVYNTFDDNRTRYFVPEVNSKEEDVHLIVRDLQETGFTFKQKSSFQLIKIKWKEGEPVFEFYDILKKQVIEIPVIGNIDMKIFNKKLCIGNRKLPSHDLIPCESTTEMVDKNKQCELCNKNNSFKYCLMCKGDICYSRNSEALEYCQNEHYVYLAYFPGEIIKVGTAYSGRRYERLHEQGALYASFICSCPTGKIARLIETKISKLGFKAAVTSKHKINNLNYNKESDDIESELILSLNKIKNEIEEKYIEYFLDNHEFINNNKIVEVLNINPPKPESTQLSFFDDFVSEGSYDILHCEDRIKGEIIAVVGSIAIIQKEKVYAFDFKKIYGHIVLI